MLNMTANNGSVDLAAIVNEALEKDIAPEVIEILKRHIEEDVYAGPTGWAGRDIKGVSLQSTGALLEDSNIIAELIQPGLLEVYDIAEPSPSPFGTEIKAGSSKTLLSQWINYGEWMDLFKFLTTGEKDKRDARPFIDNAQKEVDSPAFQDKIIDAIQKRIAK